MKTFLLLLLICLPSVATAQALRQFVDLAPFAARSDSGYLLFRSDPRARALHHGIANIPDYDFLFVRAEALSGAGIDPGQADLALVYRSIASKAYDKAPTALTYLAEIPPGRYVIAGVTFAGSNAAGTCLCMGTVEFEVKPGVVTDLGYLLAAVEIWPTLVPELVPFTNPRTKFVVSPSLIAASVRPVQAGMPLPAPLRAVPVAPARYRAFGKFSNYFHTTISRMTPVAGVLDYKGDQPISPANN